jgi:transcriptional regulator with XRE-family HTH domain
MYPNLKLQIFKLDIHQNHIARALRIDESILSKIIHGYREPSEVQRKQLADFLKAEETWLFEKYDGVSAHPESLANLASHEEKGSLT